jgi:hypothetical protein
MLCGQADVEKVFYEAVFMKILRKLVLFLIYIERTKRHTGGFAREMGALLCMSNGDMIYYE